MNQLQRLDAKAKEREASDDRNIPFSHADIKESKVEGVKLRLMNIYPNRANRKARENTGELLNNRKRTSGRKDNNVLNRMSYFALAMHAKINKML